MQEAAKGPILEEGAFRFEAPSLLFKGVLRLKTDYDKWREYETEKQKLREQDLTPEEYEIEIQRIAEKLGV